MGDSGDSLAIRATEATDREGWTRFFHAMLVQGVHLPPSPYEAWFLSTRHDGAILDRILSAADKALA